MKLNIAYLKNVMSITNIKQSCNQDTIFFNDSIRNVFDEYERMMNLFLRSNKSIHLCFSNDEDFSSFLMMYLPQKFKILYAAGGLIHDGKQRYLFIYKRGNWDLPKGKIDKNELIHIAAMRECMEETGINELTIEKHLGLTYHIFSVNQKFYLKITEWFLMYSSYNKPLHPQAEEHIEKVEWIPVGHIPHQIFPHTYPTIIEVLSRVEKF